MSEAAGAPRACAGRRRDRNPPSTTGPASEAADAGRGRAPETIWPGAGRLRRPLRPGDVIAVLGGGQLGRYLAMSAQRAGLRVWVVDPSPEAPAGALAERHFVTPFAAPDTLAALEQAAVVTCEFENLPLDAVAALAERVPFRPGLRALAVAQDRIVEKRFIAAQGLPVAPWWPVCGADLADVGARADADASPLAWPTGEAVLKTARLGYDGHGQRRLRWVAEPDALRWQQVADAWAALGRVDAVLEARLDLVAEASVVLARGHDGRVRHWGPIENEHRGGVLHRSRLPAAHAQVQAAASTFRAAAERLAVALDLVGLLTVEFFIHRGPRGELLWAVNELAPRPHNSGHVTLDAGGASQFDLQLAAVAGWALPDTSVARSVTLYNLLGAVDEATFDAITATPDARLHWYGKREARPGRKMGHVNRVGRGATERDALDARLDARAGGHVDA